MKRLKKWLKSKLDIKKELVPSRISRYVINYKWKFFKWTRMREEGLDIYISNYSQVSGGIGNPFVTKSFWKLTFNGSEFKRQSKEECVAKANELLNKRLK